METIKRGSNGETVGQLQTILKNRGYDLVVDDDFGPKTETAVVKFQIKSKIPADGIVGPQTWELLGEEGTGESPAPPVVTPPEAGTPQPPVPPPPAQPPVPTPIGVKPRASNKGNIRIALPKNFVEGLDLSHWQPDVVWKKVAAKYGFVFLKASEALQTKDKSYDGHLKGARDQGMKVGAYHFLRPDFSAEAQANFFLKVAGIQKGDLLPVLDLEQHSRAGMKHDVQVALQFMDIVAQAVGKLPILYASPSFINELGNPQEFYEHPLWIANYGVAAPNVPPPFNSWAFWQYQEQGKVDGIKASGVDHNYFAGTKEDLEKFTV